MIWELPRSTPEAVGIPSETLIRLITELKKLVHDIMAERSGNPVSHPSDPTVHYLQNTVNVVPESPVVVNPIPTVTTPQVRMTPVEEPEVQEPEEYVEENLSLDEVEKDMIRKALERHHGKRKNAAIDLKISERTLYRKIKEYGLE